MESLIKFVQDEFVTKKEFPKFNAGDTITVYYEIKEGAKTRTQFFRGVVIQIKGEGAKIVISAVRDMQNSNEVRICVKDNGPGVPNTLRHKIFEPFYTTKSQGTGLGLAVVNSVAASHQGRVSLSEPDGTGAEFNIHLPIFRNPNGLEDV